MRKCNIILLFICSFVLLGVIAGLFVSHRKIKSVEATLFVNGSENGTKVQIYSYYSELPLVEVLGELGGVISWTNENEARMALNGKVYILNLKECAFYDECDKHNLLIPAPGTTTFSCTALTDEIMLDDNTLQSVLFLMGISSTIQNSIDERRVYIRILE